MKTACIDQDYCFTWNFVLLPKDSYECILIQLHLMNPVIKIQILIMLIKIISRYGITIVSKSRYADRKTSD